MTDVLRPSAFGLGGQNVTPGPVKYCSEYVTSEILYTRKTSFKHFCVNIDFEGIKNGL